VSNNICNYQSSHLIKFQTRAKDRDRDFAEPEASYSKKKKDKKDK